MSTYYDSLLERLRALIDAGLDARSTGRALELLGGVAPAEEALEQLRLYNETLPKAEEFPFTRQTRFLHFLWDAFDKLPRCLSVNFSIPFRRLLAERLFARCGPGFICEENMRFNFAALLRVGEGVFINRNVFLDTKGGVEIGDFAALAEDVRVFSHGHSESSHLERSYAPVRIGAYAEVYSGAVILPGVTVGDESIVASHALVNRDVPPGMVVAGMPAKIIRERRSDGRHGVDLEHIWLY